MLAYLQKTEDYVQVQELMDTFHLSKRTVYYDMKKINDWLLANHLAPVDYVRGTGFLLPKESRSELPIKAKGVQLSQYYLSRNERKAWLGLHLINRTKPMFLRDMETLLQVSRGTAHSELKHLQQELKLFGLKVTFYRKQGYMVQGTEKDQRMALSHFLSELLAGISWKEFVSQIQGLINVNLYKAQFPAFQIDKLSSIYDIITDGEKAIGMELTDETVVHLAARLMLYSNRIIQGKTIVMDQEEKTALKETPQFKAAERISHELGKLYKKTFPEDEVCYITVHILAAKVNKLDAESNDLETKKLHQATSQMIDTFERLGCVFFQDRQALEKQLFLHVKSAYYRIKYGLAIENPLVDTFLDKYREVFELTQKSARPLEELLNKPIDKNEIAYLSMHFGGWLRREQVEPMKRKTAAIVCVNGVSASRMLKIQLEQLFPVIDFTVILSLREYEKYNGRVDFIFSTVPLSDSRVPVFTVNAILNDAEKAHLLNQLSPYLNGESIAAFYPSAQAIVELVKKHAAISNESALHEELKRYLLATRSQAPKELSPTLEDLLPSSRITMLEEVSDWKAAIRIASQQLLEDGSISDRYIQAMIDKVVEHGPYIVIAPGVAIAHARPEDGAIRTAMAWLSIRQGIAFGKDPKHQVHLLLVMASADGETHLKALSQLTAMLLEEKNRAELTFTVDKSEIVRRIHKYSQP